MKLMINAVLLSCAILSGCAATSTTSKGSQVELLNEKPSDSCTALGEAIGSQGNWVTGDFTSNKDLMLGARNDLRNKAAEMGGDTVYVHNLSNTNAWGSAGTTNTTVVGQVYRCK